MKHTYVVSGMHCNNCVQTVTKALEVIEGINSVKVMLDPPEAEVDMKVHISSENWLLMLEIAKYCFCDLLVVG